MGNNRSRPLPGDQEEARAQGGSGDELVSHAITRESNAAAWSRAGCLEGDPHMTPLDLLPLERRSQSTPLAWHRPSTPTVRHRPGRQLGAQGGQVLHGCAHQTPTDSPHPPESLLCCFPLAASQTLGRGSMRGLAVPSVEQRWRPSAEVRPSPPKRGGGRIRRLS